MNFEFSNSRGSFRKWTCVLLAILISFSCFQLSAPVIAAYASDLVTGGNVTAGNVTSGNVTGGNVTDGNLKLESCNGVFLALNQSGTEYYVYKVGSDIFINIPSSYNGKPVTGIGNSAFECSRVVYVTVPDSIKYIGNMAFRYCSRLAYITIPDSVTSIGDYAFYGCWDLGSVTIPDSVTTIGAHAFAGCERVYSITIPDSVTSIGEYAFDYTGYYNDSNNWENGVLYIGNHLIDTETYIYGEYAIKNGTKTIAGRAFFDCSLTSIIIPDSVTSIGNGAFSWCTSLTSITIPDSVTSIGNGAFYECYSLTSITIPNGVTSIGDYALYDCSLTSITIHDGVTSIGDYAFSDCSLTSIIIPDSVTSIGNGAFSWCTSLTDVYYDGAEANWANITIGSENYYLNSAKIHYSEHSISDWIIEKNATCTEAGSKYKECTSCKAVLETATIPAAGHTPVTDSAVAATCTKPGKTQGSHCSVCNTILFAQQTVAATGHTKVTDKAVEATCTTAGKTEGSHCSACNTVIVAQQTVAATGHTKVTDKAVAATCTSAGKTEGSHCSVCNVVIVAQMTIPAKGHTYSDWIIDKVATCTEAGSKHKECTECEIALKTEAIPAKGHTASALKYNEKTRTEYKECTVCKTILESKYIPVPTTAITSCYNEVKGVQLKWNAVADAAKYEIYRKLPTELEWTKLTTVSTLAYQDTAVTGNTIYQYAIKAVDQYGNASDYSAQRECRFIATPTLKSISNSVGGLTITWEKVAGATSYRIYRRGAGTNYWYYLGDVSASQNTFFDKESSLVSSGNYYRYTVRASYSGKDSAGKDYLIYSGFDTNGLYIKYMASPKLTSISNATNGLQIKWNAVAGVTNGYRVYRRGAGSTYWTYLGTVKTTSYTDTAVKNKSGEYFRYTVIADGGKHSAFDTNGLYLKRLANPTLKSATSAKAGITVKWNAVAGTTGYYVYRKTANSGWTRIAAVSGTNNTTYLDKTAQKGVTYVYTVRAVYGSTTSYFDAGISCKDLY